MLFEVGATRLGGERDTSTPTPICFVVSRASICLVFGLIGIFGLGASSSDVSVLDGAVLVADALRSGRAFVLLLFSVLTGFGEGGSAEILGRSTLVTSVDRSVFSVGGR